MHPSSPSADYISDALLRLCFGRAVFCCPLFRRTGEHDCASPAVAPRGASRRRLKSLLKHRVQGAALPAMHPSSPSADLSQYATLRLCLGRAVFCCPFPGELGSTTAHLRRLPRKGRAGGAYKSLLKHRVQGCALPAMLPSSPSADLSQYATLRLCFGRAVFCCPLFRRTGEHDCASPAVAPRGASRRRLLILAQASRAGRSPASDAPQFSKR